MKRSKNEKGIALIYVILIMVVGAILVTGMIAMSQSENRQSIYQTKNMKAYYIARAGADTVIHRLETIDKQYWDDFTTQHITTPTAYGDGSFTVSVLRTGDDFEVVSTGTYQNVQQVAKAVLRYDAYTKMDFAIYAKDPIVGLSLDTLIGDIGSGGTIAFGNTADEGSYRPNCQEHVKMNPEVNTPVLTEVLADLKNTVKHPLYPESIALNGNGNTTTTTASTYFTDVQVTHNGASWIINTDNAEYYKYNNEALDQLEMTKTPQTGGKWMVIYIEDPSEIAGTLQVTGNNNLMIIVEDQLEISGPITLSGTGKVEIHLIDTSNDNGDYDFNFATQQAVIGVPSDPGRMQIYMADGTTMNFATNGCLYGYIIGPDSKISMSNGSTDLFGALYAKIVDINSSVGIHYSVPDDSDAIRLESIQFAYWE